MPTKKIRLPARSYRQAQLSSHNTKYQRGLPREGNYVGGEGDPLAKVMVIGESPGEEEDRSKRPFVGPSGVLMDKMFAEIGIDRGDLYITNLIKVRPPNNQIEQVVDEVPPAVTLMRWEVAIINPRVIVTMGRWAASVFFQNFSITEIAGCMYVKDGRVVVPMLHPSFILRDRTGRARKEYLQHFQLLKTIIIDVNEGRGPWS